MADHSTKSHNPYAVDNRRSNPGRPTDVMRGIDPRDKDVAPPEGDILYPRLRVWITGEIILREDDFEGHEYLRMNLTPALEEMSHRMDETATRTKGALVLSEQIVGEGVEMGRRHALRTIKRYTLSEVEEVIQCNPGLTVPQLTKIFFPRVQEQSTVEARVRVMVSRLHRAGKAEPKKNHGDFVRWYPIEKLEIGWATKRQEVIARTLALRFGGSPADYQQEAMCLEPVIQYNEKRKVLPDAWVHPTDEPF